MRCFFPWFGFLAAAASLSSPPPAAGPGPAPPGAIVLPSAARPAETSPLPATLPGYELRVLDVRKPVIIEAGSQAVRASLPVFFYYPVSDVRAAARLVRRAYEELTRLSQQPEWSADELKQVVAGLRDAAELLEK